MLELLVLATLGFVGLLVAGLIGLVAGTIFWVFVLPFRILGWMLHGVLGLTLGVVFLPVLIVAGALALVVGAMALPAAPLIVLGVIVWLIVRRRRQVPTAR